MLVKKYETCHFCGKELSSGNALKYENKLICTDFDCMTEPLSWQTYEELCKEFVEETCKEQFAEWLAENYFYKAKDEDIEYLEEE